MELLDILSDTKTEYGNFYAGERRMCERTVARLLKDNGWARPHKVKLEVDNAKLGVNAEDAG